MIIPGGKEDTLQPASSKADIAALESDAAGPSNAHEDPPPAFEDIEEDTHLLSDFTQPPNPDGVSGPPPVFSHYEADFFTVGDGDIVSHDPHLNTDGMLWYLTPHMQ